VTLNSTSTQLGYTVSLIHIGSCWKIQDRGQITNTDNTQTKQNPEKSKQQKLPWFSRLSQHSTRKRGGLIQQCFQADINTEWLSQTPTFKTVLHLIC